MNLSDVLETLKRADAAGDTEAATKLALMYRRLMPKKVEAVDLNSGSIADALGQGAMFGFSDEIAGGLGASVNSVANLFGAGSGESFGKAYEGIRDAARYNLKNYQKNNPKTALAAELAGGLLTGGAGAARAGVFKGGSTVGKMAGVGAVEGGLFGAGSSKAEDVGGLLSDTAKGAALGGVTGGLIPAIGKVGKKIFSRTPTPNPINQIDDLVRLSSDDIADVASQTRRTSSSYADDVALLKSEGIDMTTGQLTGSTGVKAFETTIDKTLWGGAVDKTFEKQRSQLQSRLMKMAGFPEDIAQAGRITEDAIDAAGDHLSKKYSEVLKGKSITLGDDFINDLARIEAKHSRLLTPQQRREIPVLIDDFLNEAVQTSISGSRYQSLRSFVGQRARKQKMSNPIISDLFSDMKGALDSAFIKATGGSSKALNVQYAQFKQLETLWQRLGGVKVAQGELPLASLNALAKKSPGSKAWRKLINAASGVLGDATPNSGTASRLANLKGSQKIGDLLTGGIPTYLMNQLMAKGVGGGAPQAVKGLLSATGKGLDQTSKLLGTTGGPIGLAAFPGLLSQPPLPDPNDPLAPRFP